MKHLLILYLLFLFFPKGYSQSAGKITITGRIIDTESKTWLSEATVTCLNEKDSSKTSLVFTNKNGSFSLDNLPSNNYILYITFLGYQAIMYPVKKTSSSTTIDLGTIEMKRTSLLLNSIEIVESRNLARITRDTIEFNTAYFKTKENSLVEDLLKIIPGIQIDKDGTITVNGEVVKTIMVNGKSLFMDDPKSIIKNLQADLIDKVQLIDRSPDQRKLQTIDDRRTDKVINITIKKSQENVVSGELSAAYGIPDHFGVKTNLSRFNSHQQLLLLGGGDNVNGALDSKSLGNGGLQRAWNGGLSYSEEINKKISININYQVSNNKSLNKRNSIRQNFFDDSSSLYSQVSNNDIISTNHSVSIQMEYNIDSLQQITISNYFSLSKTYNTSTNTYESTNDSNQILNDGSAENTDKNTVLSIGESLYYKKKFKKKGRKIEISFSYRKGTSRTLGYNKSNSLYLPSNNHSIVDSIDQRLINYGTFRQIFLMTSYTEPVTPNGSIIFTIAEDNLKNDINKSTYNYNLSTKLYDHINDSLSNIFQNQPTQHFAKLGWLFQKEKIDYSASIITLLYDATGKNISQNININNRTIKFLPDFTLSLSSQKNSRIRFSYRKLAEFPEISQLQPIADNRDPIYVKMGNPDLLPTNIHDLNLSYNVLNYKNLRYFSFSISGQQRDNQIVNSIYIDSIGRQTIKPMNLGSGYNLNFNIETGLPINNEQNSLYLITKGTMNKMPNSINGIAGSNKDLSLTQSFRFSLKYKNIFDLNLAGNASYNNVTYLLPQTNRSSFLSGGATFNGNLKLPYGITIGTDLYIGWATGRMKGFNNNPKILNAYISKTFFSHKQGLLQLQGFDLLKQNTNISRSVGVNYIEDVSSNILERFFILKFSYFLGKKK